MSIDSPRLQHQAQQQSYWQPYNYPHPMNKISPLSHPAAHQPYPSSPTSTTLSCSYCGQPQHDVPQYYYYAPVFCNCPSSPSPIQHQPFYQHQQQYRHRSPLTRSSSRSSRGTTPVTASHHLPQPSDHHWQRSSPSSSRSLRPRNSYYTQQHQSSEIPPPMVAQGAARSRPPLSRPTLSSRTTTATPKSESSNASANLASSTKARERPSLNNDSSESTPSHRQSIARRLLHRLTWSTKSSKHV